jgi:hypothetical protein
MKKIFIPLFILTVSTALLTGCQQDSAAIAPGGTGVGGSLARFAIIGNYLYTLDFNTLRTFDISAPKYPVLRHETPIGGGMETIFPLGELLFLGAQEGMHIYRVRTDGLPQFVSLYRHVQSCDPVVANDLYAYVTLRAGCGGGPANTLDVISIADVENPKVVNSLELNQPHGLGLDGDLLFVCAGINGLKIFSLSNPEQPDLITQIDNITAHDVIPLDGLLLVIGPEKIVQFSYQKVNGVLEISRLSEMAIGG